MSIRFTYMNTAYIHDSFVSQNAFIFHDNEMFFTCIKQTIKP